MGGIWTGTGPGSALDSWGGKDGGIWGGPALGSALESWGEKDGWDLGWPCPGISLGQLGREGWVGFGLALPLDQPWTSLLAHLLSAYEARLKHRGREQRGESKPCPHSLESLALPAPGLSQTEPQELQQELGFQAHPSPHLPGQTPGFSIRQH